MVTDLIIENHSPVSQYRICTPIDESFFTGPGETKGVDILDEGREHMIGTKRPVWEASEENGRLSQVEKDAEFWK